MRGQCSDFVRNPGAARLKVRWYCEFFSRRVVIAADPSERCKLRRRRRSSRTRRRALEPSRRWTGIHHSRPGSAKDRSYPALHVRAAAVHRARASKRAGRPRPVRCRAATPSSPTAIRGPRGPRSRPPRRSESPRRRSFAAGRPPGSPLSPNHRPVEAPRCPSRPENRPPEAPGSPARQSSGAETLPGASRRLPSRAPGLSARRRGPAQSVGPSGTGVASSTGAFGAFARFFPA